jgi:hypothetical protein
MVEFRGVPFLQEEWRNLENNGNSVGFRGRDQWLSQQAETCILRQGGNRFGRDEAARKTSGKQEEGWKDRTSTAKLPDAAYVCLQDNRDGRALWLSHVRKRQLDNKKKDKRVGEACNIDSASVQWSPTCRRWGAIDAQKGLARFC